MVQTPRKAAGETGKLYGVAPKPVNEMSLLASLLELQPLEHLPRTGWAARGIPNPESVASHINATCLVALALAPRVQPALDTDRCLALALVHDVPEALIGDLPKAVQALLPDGAKRQAEDAAAQQLLEPLSTVGIERWQEYRSGESREARLVRLCDRLQLGMRLVAYERSGRRDLKDFHSVLRDLDCSEFQAAEELRLEILAELERPS